MMAKYVELAAVRPRDEDDNCGSRALALIASLPRISYAAIEVFMCRAQEHIRTVMLSSRDAQIVELWLEKHPSPHTRYCYRIDSERLLNHTKKPISRITLADLQNFAQHLGSLGLAPISRARSLAAVKGLFAFCHRMRYLPVNPAAELTLPSYENRLAERILGEEEVQRMLAAETEPRNRLLLRLLYAAGLRISEACSLRWRNLHLRGTAGQITVFGRMLGRGPLPCPMVCGWNSVTAVARRGPRN